MSLIIRIITPYLIIIGIALVLGGAVLLFRACLDHAERMKMHAKLKVRYSDSSSSYESKESR